MSKYSFEFIVSVRNTEKNEQMYLSKNVWENLSYDQMLQLELAAKGVLDQALEWGKTLSEIKKV